MGSGGSNATRVYAHLRERLLRGELPGSVPLVEQQLAAEYDTSRTPVREALRRLEGDGHLVRDGSGRLRPTVPSVQSMADLYEVRAAIEELTVRRAAAAGDRAALGALRAEWRALAADRDVALGPEFVHTDESFHRRIAEAAGNRHALRLLADLNDRIRLLRIHEFTSRARGLATIAEHLEIVDAILAADGDAAAAFMLAHVKRSALVARAHVDDALARMQAAG